MAKPEFILQGSTGSTHIEALQRLFALPDVQRVLVSVAFVTDGGVGKIEANLIPHAACATVFAGIRNDTTSYQGLARLHGIISHLHTVDTGSRAIIFHPKLCLARAPERARLLIGSANLTVAGLNNNIEAGVLLDFDLALAADKALIDNIEELFASAVTDYPDHVVKVGNIAELDELLAAGRLVDESKDLARREAPRLVDQLDSGVDGTETDGDGEGVPLIRLKPMHLKSGLATVNAIPGELDVCEPQEAIQEATISPPVAASELELNAQAVASSIAEPEVTSVPLFNYYRPKRRSGDGPRIRARRAKQEAMRLGKKWYFTGEPCINGHITDRLVSNGKCRECSRLDCGRYNRFNFNR
jgi:hypothetical protein